MTGIGSAMQTGFFTLVLLAVVYVICLGPALTFGLIEYRTVRSGRHEYMTVRTLFARISQAVWLLVLFALSLVPIGYAAQFVKGLVL